MKINIRTKNLTPTLKKTNLFLTADALEVGSEAVEELPGQGRGQVGLGFSILVLRPYGLLVSYFR